MKQTNLSLIKQAFDEADLNWGGAWTVRNVALPDWIRDLLDGYGTNDNDSSSMVKDDGISGGYGSKKSSKEEENSEEASALEGLLREQTGYTRTRDRRLRNQAIAQSKAICEVCEVDFSKVLDGRGVRALQVHHRNQLVLSDLPVITMLSDLAVVCANCHALIHMDQSKALTVEELKHLLAGASA